MANIYKRVASKIENSPVVIPIALACLLGLVISCFAMWSDYQSSRYGYEWLPTRKADEVVWIIAMLPQVGQIIFVTLFSLSVQQNANGSHVANYWYLFISAALFIWDLSTDMYFKAHGMAFIVWVIAFIESIVIYTIGSEVLMVASFGLLVYLAPMAVKQASEIVSSFVVVMGGNSDQGPKPPGHR